MELRASDIIKKTIITNKSIDLFKRFGQITFEVHRKANKVMVRKAIENIWEVKVDNVRVINVPGKSKMFARKAFRTSDWKKALITLKKGHKIDIPGMFESMGAAESMPAETTNTPAEKE